MAAKIVTDDLENECFVAEMFGKDSTAFASFLQAVIDAVSARLSARVGATVYDTATEPTASDIKEAELQYCIEELWRKRIAFKLGNAQGDNVSCKYESESRDKARDKGDEILCRLTGGDFSSSVVESSYYLEA